MRVILFHDTGTIEAYDNYSIVETERNEGTIPEVLADRTTFVLERVHNGCVTWRAGDGRAFDEPIA